MNCLGRAEYDPTSAVAESVSAALAMTALDTTNLRLTFTVPASGLAQVRLKGTVIGGSTLPTLLLGVLEGATVIFRSAPMGAKVSGQATAVEASGVITGLTPGVSKTWDAAYGVETTATPTLNYGGPDDTTAANAWGAFQFEVFEA